MTDKHYAKRVAQSVVEMAAQEFGEAPPIERVMAIVEGHLGTDARPKKREEFAAWIFENDREALRP